MELYPTKKTVTQEESVDEAQLAADMIDAILNNPEYEKPQVTSAAQAGRDIPLTASRVFDEIFADKTKMASVNVNDCSTVTEYKAKLAEDTQYLSADTWYSELLKSESVTKFDDLKTEVVVAKEIV